MEEKTLSIWKQTLTWGLYLGLVLVLVSVIFYVTGNPFSKSVQFISIGLMIAAVIISQLKYRDLQGGFISYKTALIVGFLTVVFAYVVFGFYNYILYALIDPSLYDQMRLTLEEQLVKAGTIPEDQIEAAIEMAMKMQTPMPLFFITILNGAITGFLISLISAIFTKKIDTKEIL